MNKIHTHAHITPAQASTQQLLRASNWPHFCFSSFSLFMLFFMKRGEIMSSKKGPCTVAGTHKSTIKLSK